MPVNRRKCLGTVSPGDESEHVACLLAEIVEHSLVESGAARSTDWMMGDPLG